MEEIDYQGLEDIVKDKQEVAIFIHGDPDGIGSGLGVQVVLKERFGIKSEIFCPGLISFPQNKSLVNLAGIDLIPVDSFDPEKYQNNVVLVDCVKNDLVENPLVVIDHHEHEKEEEVKAQFKHIDKKVGACVTIVLKMLSHYQIKLDNHKKIVLAMAYGIKSDTENFGPDSTEEDLDAFRSLYPLIAKDLLWTIEHPPKTAASFNVLASAIKNKEIKDGYLIAGVGIVTESNAIPEAAVSLLTHRNVETTIIYGIFKGHLKVRLRTKDPTENVRERVEIMFGREFAGGHRTAAGADIPLYHDYLIPSEGDSFEYTDKLWTPVNDKTLSKIHRAIKTENGEEKPN